MTSQAPQTTTADQTIKTILAAVESAAAFTQRAINGGINTNRENPAQVKIEAEASEVILSNAAPLLAELRMIRTAGF